MEDPEEDIRAVMRNQVRHCILSIFHQLELRGVENGHLENAQYRLEWLLSLVTRYHESNFIEHGVVDLISEALELKKFLLALLEGQNLTSLMNS